MIGVNVSFQYEGSFDRARVIGIADQARARFEGMPGLRSKLFSVLPELREARNLYVWDDPEAARRLFTPESRDRIAALYGVQPIIEYAEVCALVENSRV